MVHVVGSRTHRDTDIVRAALNYKTPRSQKPVTPGSFKTKYMKKELVKIIIKVLIYALTLLGAYLGVTSMSSCSSSQIATHRGFGIFQYVDTFRTSGKSTLNY